MEILIGVLVFGMLACGVLAIRASRLVVSSLWLAALSILLAVLIYVLGAPRIAVIELSVGAGLVTILLVFVVGIAGDEGARESPLIPRFISWGLAALSLALLGWFTVPLETAPPPVSQASLTSLLWQDRALDVLVQVVLVFCGVTGVLGLLSGATAASRARSTETAEVPPAMTEPRPAAEERKVPA